MSQRLCEIKEEMLPATIEIVKRGGSAWARLAVDELRCPHAGGCDKSARRCDGMTPENCQRIEEIKNVLWRHGFVRVEELR